jgi:hypothetical protein
VRIQGFPAKVLSPIALSVLLRSPCVVTPVWKFACTDHCRLLAMPSVPAGGLVVAVSFTTRLVMLSPAGAVTVASALLVEIVSPPVLVDFTR